MPQKFCNLAYVFHELFKGHLFVSLGEIGLNIQLVKVMLLGGGKSQSTKRFTKLIEQKRSKFLM